MSDLQADIGTNREDDAAGGATVSRRTVLAGLGAAGAVGALAACSSAAPSSGTPTGPAAGPSAGSSTGSSTGSATRRPASRPLAQLDSIPVGTAKAATLDNKPVVVARPTATTAACFSAICTHLGCTVAPAGKQLHCPCHGSVYDATTGNVLAGPAPRPLPRVAVVVKDGNVLPA